MKRHLLPIILLVFSYYGSFEASSIVASTDRQEVIKVWICTGPGAYAYHNNRACSGLNNCKASIKQVTLEEAVKKYGRQPCKKCYKLLVSKDKGTF